MAFQVADRSMPPRMPRRRRRFATVAVGVLFLMGFATDTTFAVVKKYAGVIASGQKQGIRGYILQPDSGTVSSPETVLSWIGLCGNNCAAFNYYNGDPDGPVWVQLGMYQGDFKGGTSTTSVHVYYENMTPCGDYHADDIGIPVSNPYWFRVQYNGGGLQSFTCDTISGPHTGYKFGYKKGSSTNADFFQGWMTTLDGRADANTEWHDTPPQATVYFGCASSATCLPDYGIGVRSLSQWGLCCSAVSEEHGNPPYMHLISVYYSFRTCQTSGAC